MKTGQDHLSNSACRPEFKDKYNEPERHGTKEIHESEASAEKLVICSRPKEGERPQTNVEKRRARIFLDFKSDNQIGCEQEPLKADK